MAQWKKIGPYEWGIDDDKRRVYRRHLVRDAAISRTEVMALRNAELLALPVDGEVWTWLRAQGVRRPSPSGTRGEETRTEADREGARVRLSEDTIQRADALADEWGCSRAAAIERAVMASKPRVASDADVDRAIKRIGETHGELLRGLRR